MSKLGCECGAVLSDVSQEDSERYWGIIMPSGELYDAEEKASQDIALFMGAYSKGEGNDWLIKYFGDQYPLDMNLSSFISDILVVHFNRSGLAYGRCKKCKSILIQNEKESSNYNRYQPMKAASKGI
jgi:hypothetical protein